MKDWFIKKLGGYTKADRHEMLTEIVSDLYQLVKSEDVLRINEAGQVTYLNKPLTEEQIKALSAESRAFMESGLWKVLHNELRNEANKKMFLKSTELVHLESGKLLLYYVKFVNDKLKEIGSLRG